MRSDNPLCREESSRMLSYAAQGVSCAARVIKPLTSGTSSKPKVLHPTARAASQESRVFDTKNCLVGCLAPTARGAAPPASMLDASAQEQSTSALRRAGSKIPGFRRLIPGFRQPISGTAHQIRFGTSRLHYRGVQGIVRSRQCIARGTGYRYLLDVFYR